nr:triple gene block protein 2 [Wheat yellow stripe virus]
MSRELRARPNHMIPIIVGVCVVALFMFLGYSQQKHRTHSAGDFGVPTFANGGSYADGTRSAKFNSNNNLAYGCRDNSRSSFKSASDSAKYIVYGILIFCAWMIFRALTSESDSPHVCGPGCGCTNGAGC